MKRPAERPDSTHPHTNHDMELRQLRYFVQAARQLNFSEAARQLCITQSTLSQQIRQLEDELGQPLFVRDSHNVTLTEAGRELLPLATGTIRSAETCAERLDDLQHLRTGTLNIGVTYTFSPILTETVLTFMKRYPGIRLNIHYKSMEELMEELECREVDFVLSFRPTRNYPNISSHILFDNHLSAIVAAGHPLARQESVTPEQLARYDLALPARGLQARYSFDRLAAHCEQPFRIRVELNEVNILLRLALGSNLVTILSEASIRDQPGLRAIPIDRPEGQMEGCVHLLKKGYRKASSREFVRLLCESNAIRERISQWIEKDKIFAH